MIRAPRLAVSRPMYAFNPSTWRHDGYFWQVDAVWFKRKNGILSAVRGTYHPFVQPFTNEPGTGSYEDWIAAANDNRYGGKWAAKWNGDGLLVYETPASPDTMRGHIDFLDAMLQGFPAVPVGYDGWWTLPR